MRKHLGKARYPLILIVAALVVFLFFEVRSRHHARGAFLLPNESELSVGLIRAGLDPLALAAAGLSANGATSVVGDVFEHLVDNELFLEAIDANWAALRRQCSQLQRIVRAGIGTPEQVAALPGLKAQLAQAASQREAAVDAIFEAATLLLNQSQRDALATIRAERAQWDLPVEFLVISQTEPDRVLLREYLANERISAEAGEPADPTAQAWLTQLRSNPAVALAKANLDANLALIEAAWNDAVSPP